MRKPFSAWKEGARYYGPLLAGGALLSMTLLRTSAVYGGLFFLGLGLFALFFFRDPPRTITAGENEIVCPADGTVVGVEELRASPYYEGACKRVSIFLSVLSCHVNRSPADGVVRAIRYQPGTFRNAMNAQSADSNESNAVWIETRHGPITVRQISGAIARRIVCVLHPNDTLRRGERFGMIKLGSRTEIYLPPTADICVRMKQKVKAGMDVVARFS